MRAALLLPGAVLAAAVASAAPLKGQVRPRLDPRFRIAELVAPDGRGPDARLQAFGASRARGLGLLGSGDAGELRVFVRGSGDVAAAIVAAGGRVRARAGDIIAASLPAAGLGALAADPRVAALEPVGTLATQTAPPAGPGPRGSRPPAPRPPRRGALLDVATDDIRVGPLRQRIAGRFEGIAGQGIVVGIVDSGLDLGHPDFRRPDGSTRVLWALDLTDDGGPAPGAVGSATFPEGSECDAATIDAGDCRMRDLRGHGTHVLGIAAGDGSATGNGRAPFRYVGVAPEADLIVVKAGEATFAADDVLAGVAYVFERAAELGRPAVVALALGTQAGPHDGSTALERGLDALVGPGRIAVVTAGNQGAYDNESPDFPAGPIHLTGQTEPGAPVEHTLVVPSYVPTPGAGNDAVLLEIWYEGATDVAITVTPPGGDPVRAEPGDTAVGQSSAGAVFIDNASAGPSPDNGDNQALVLIFDAAEGEEPAQGAWAIGVETVAGLITPLPHHGWIVGSTFQGAIATPRIDRGATNSHVVTTPANGGRMLAVGAHATRHAWPGLAGQETFAFREPLGDIAFFSSPGPRRDGVLRPDVTAPGKMVVASYAAGGSDFAVLPSLIEADGVHAALLGTSMATPQVAGAVALLLQREARLTPEDARAILRGSARADEFVEARGGAGSHPWGFGKLDALGAVRSFGSPAGLLTVAAAPATPATTVAEGRAGEVLELLDLQLVASLQEPILVNRLRVDLAGGGAGDTLLLVLDGDADGEIGAGDTELAAVAAGTGGADLGGTLTVPSGFALDVLVGLRLGGGIVNGATVRAVLPQNGVGTEGVLSGAVDAVNGPSVDVASPLYRVDLLASGETVALSANPVRGERLVVNYGDTPLRAAVYTAAGRLVRDFTDVLGAEGPGRFAWDLTDGAGRPVANGAYYLFLELADGRVRQTVYVLRP